MKHISFKLTPDQIRERTKTVTRRIGWNELEPGTLLQPVMKVQGLKKGEHVEKIGGPIRVVSVRRERLCAMLNGFKNGAVPYGEREVQREGFPTWSPEQFVEFFCDANDCTPRAHVTRIEFEYLDG